MIFFRLAAGFVLVLIPIVSFAKPLPKGEFPVGRATIECIVEDVRLIPLLAPFGEKPLNIGTLPPFAAKKLTEYAIDPRQTSAAEKKLWQANRDKYERDYPLRATFLEAAEVMEKANTLKVRTSLPAPVNPKTKAAFLLEQAPLGITIFQLEGALRTLKEAGEQRDKEKSKRWQANFDFALMRLQTNLVLLYEYNYTLGTIRADALPEIGKDHDGWRIAFMPKIRVAEGKARAYAKDRAQLLKKIQEEHAGTPWAYFAERDGKRDLGMAWEPKNK
jgi:hypothetical protein